MAFLGYTSEESKAEREAYLQRMRERWNRAGTKPKAELSQSARSQINSANASGPRLWARSSLTAIIEGLGEGESIWLDCNSHRIHGAARTAKRKVVTRTAFKNGVQGVRVTAMRTSKKRSHRGLG